LSAKKNNAADTTGCYLLSAILDQCADKEVETYALQLKNKADKGLTLLPPDHPLQRTFKGYLGTALNDLGLAYREKGDMIHALDYLQESILIREALNNHTGLGENYNNMAAVYFDIGDNNKALGFLEKSYAMLKDQGHDDMILSLLINLGYLYYVNNRIDDAMTCYQSGLALAERTGDEWSVSKCLTGAALVLVKRKNYRQALDNYNRSLAIIERLGSADDIAETLIDLADCYIMQNDYKSAQKYGERAYHIAQTTQNITSLRHTSGSLQYVYEQQGNYKAALDMEKLNNRMRDSTNNESTRKAALKKQIEYEYDKKEIILKEEQARLKKLYDQRQSFMLILAIVLVALTLIIVYSLYLRYKFKKEEESKNLHIELKERLKQEITEKESIASSLIHIQEHERQKLAAELHDGVNQLLFAARIQLQASKSVEEPMHREAVNLVETAINEIKSIAANEGSLLLRNKSLKDAIRDLILQMKGDQHLDISFLNYGFDESRLNADQSINCLRIMQELLSNALRHASATAIFISVKTTPGAMLFAVTDNGKGLAANRTDNNGLKNISNKVSLMKGNRRIFSIAGKGTKIFIRIPLA